MSLAVNFMIDFAWKLDELICDLAWYFLCSDSSLVLIDSGLVQGR